ncbi:DX39B helicase, partial [Crocuta crocuta]
QTEIFVKSVPHCIALAHLLVEQNFPGIAIHHGSPRGLGGGVGRIESVMERCLLCLGGKRPLIERTVNIFLIFFLTRVSWCQRPEQASSLSGFAVIFVSSENHAKMLSEVQGHTEVSGSELPDEMDISSSSEY